MAKIRGVKPELWTDENFVELSPFARLLWMGLWNHACDNGHLQDKSKQIKMRVLPTDDVNCAELLREIESQRLIERLDGWITIPNLSHHQKPHRRWWTTCEKPGCDLPEGASHTPNNRGATVVPPKHNRGTTADVDCDVDCDVDTCASDEDASDSGSDFASWWSAYPRKRGKGQAEKAYKAAKKKTDAATLLAALVEQAPSLMAKGAEFAPYPATWLNGERWDDEPDNLRILPPAESPDAWMMRRPQK